VTSAWFGKALNTN